MALIIPGTHVVPVVHTKDKDVRTTTVVVVRPTTGRPTTGRNDTRNDTGRQGDPRLDITGFDAVAWYAPPLRSGYQVFPYLHPSYELLMRFVLSTLVLLCLFFVCGVCEEINTWKHICLRFFMYSSPL